MNCFKICHKVEQHDNGDAQGCTYHSFGRPGETPEQLDENEPKILVENLPLEELSFQFTDKTSETPKENAEKLSPDDGIALEVPLEKSCIEDIRTTEALLADQITTIQTLVGEVKKMKDDLSEVIKGVCEELGHVKQQLSAQIRSQCVLASHITDLSVENVDLRCKIIKKYEEECVVLKHDLKQPHKGVDLRPGESRDDVDRHV